MSHLNRTLNSGLVIEVWIGRITKEEVFDYVGRYWSEPNKFPDHKIFVDITRASFDPTLGEKEIQQIIDLYQPSHYNISMPRIAILAATNFEGADLFGRLGKQKNLNVIVFTSLSPACIWLGEKILEVQKVLERVHSELEGYSPTSKLSGNEEARLKIMP